MSVSVVSWLVTFPRDDFLCIGTLKGVRRTVPGQFVFTYYMPPKEYCA